MSAVAVDAGHLWLAAYFVLNLSLTIYNKLILLDFRYPWTLTAIHTLCGAIGCYTLYLFKFFQLTKLSEKENLAMISFSILYTVNIAISNVSLNLVSVPFHQVVRAMTPVFTVMISVIYFQKNYSRMIYLSLLPVVLGVVFATIGEYDYTYMGLFLTVLGTVLAALKTLVTNRMLVGRLKLHPLDLLFRMSPMAFLQCIIYAYASGELGRIREAAPATMSIHLVVAILLNGVLAFALNVVSFTANKMTSALTMTVAGNVKQVLSIGIAVVIFELSINATNALGIFLTLLGGAWYGQMEQREREKASQYSQLPISQNDNASTIGAYPMSDKQ